MALFTDAVPPETWAPFAPLLDALLGEGGALDAALKEALVLAAAAIRGAESIAPARPARDAREAAVLGFCRKLAGEPVSVAPDDVARLREAGLGDEEILEAVLATGCGTLLGVLGRGRPARLPAPAASSPPAAVRPRPPEERQGPYLRVTEKTPAELPAFATLKERFGFVPRLYRAQSLAPAAVEAETRVLETLLFGATTLSKDQKHAILVAVSAANCNTYGATLHGRVLQMTGMDPASVERLASDPSTADLPEAERALLETARRAGAPRGELDAPDFEALGGIGWTSEQVAEALTLAALAAFLHTVQMGLGVPPDFRPKRDYVANPPQGLKLSGAAPRPTGDEGNVSARAADPDAPLVAEARGGDMGAFEALVKKHQGRVYRTLLGITSNAEDAQDGTQSVFLKVFRKLRDFEGQSLFSTWLHRIAVNEGLERLRGRRPTETLEANREEDFRPSSLEPWIEDPESRFARDELRRIVEAAIGRLPTPYRAALLLRDIQQMSGAEAAAALGIPLPTLKTHLMRGRLMLREALAGVFAAPQRAAGA